MSRDNPETCCEARRLHRAHRAEILITLFAGMTTFAIACLAGAAVCFKVIDARTPPPPPPAAPPPAPETHIHVDAQPIIAAPPVTWTLPKQTAVGLPLSEIPQLIRSWSGVAVSGEAPDAIAAWSEDTLALSHDDGRTFRHLPLDGARMYSPVVLDRRGTAFVAHEDGKLDVVRADGSVAHHKLPIEGRPEWLVAGGDWLACLGDRRSNDKDAETVFALSRDEGKTWTTAEPPHRGNAGNDARMDANGALWTMSATEASCGGGYQDRSLGHATGGGFAVQSWPFDAWRFWIGAGGFAYAVAPCVESDIASSFLCAVGPGENAPSMAGPKVRDDENVEVATNGKTTLALVGSRLYRVSGGKFDVLVDRVPVAMAQLGVDARGRAVGLAGGRVIRYSKAEGFRVLMAP